MLRVSNKPTCKCDGKDVPHLSCDTIFHFSKLLFQNIGRKIERETEKAIERERKRDIERER